MSHIKRLLRECVYFTRRNIRRKIGSKLAAHGVYFPIPLCIAHRKNIPLWVSYKKSKSSPSVKYAPFLRVRLSINHLLALSNWFVSNWLSGEQRASNRKWRSRVTMRNELNTSLSVGLQNQADVLSSVNRIEHVINLPFRPIKNRCQQHSPPVPAASSKVLNQLNQDLRGSRND